MEIAESSHLPPLQAILPGTKIALRDVHTKPFDMCLDHKQTFTPSPSINAKVALPDSDDIIYLDNALTAKECTDLCKEVDASSALSFWSPAGRDNDQARAFRDADTIEVQSPTLAQQLWERIKSYLPSNLNPESDQSKISIQEEYDADGNVDCRWERELVGTWIPCGLNHDLLFAKYPPGGSFAPHTDGRAIHDFNTRSFYSVIIFLNDLPDNCGGGTRFYAKKALQNLTESPTGQWTADPSLVTVDVSPQAGRILIFEQSHVHEGVPPLGGCKYIIRSDVMFRRLIPLCDTPQDKIAYEMYRSAEQLAENGDPDAAVQLFRKALKLSPQLSQIMGQS